MSLEWKINSDFLSKIPKIQEYKKDWINPYEKEEINMAKNLWIQAEKLLLDIENQNLKNFLKKELIAKLNIAFKDWLSPTEYWEIKQWLKEIENKFDKISQYELEIEVKDKIKKLINKRFKQELSDLETNIIKYPNFPIDKLFIKALYQTFKKNKIKPEDKNSFLFFKSNNWIIEWKLSKNWIEKWLQIFLKKNADTDINFKIIPSSKIWDILIYKNNIYLPDVNKIYENVKNLKIKQTNNFIKLSFDINDQTFILYILKIKNKEYYFSFTINKYKYKEIIKNIKDPFEMEKVDVKLYNNLLKIKKASNIKKISITRITNKKSKAELYIPKENIIFSKLPYKKRMKIIKETLEKDPNIDKTIRLVIDNLAGTTIHLTGKKIKLTKEYINKHYKKLKQNLIQLVLFIIDIESKWNPLAKNFQWSSARWLWQWLTKNGHRSYEKWKKIWKTSSWETTLNKIWLTYPTNKLPKINNYKWELIKHPIKITPTKIYWKDQLKILILSLWEKNKELKEYLATALTWNIRAIEKIYEKFHHTKPDKKTKELIKKIAKNFFTKLKNLEW